MRKTFECVLEKSETVPYWLAARLPFDPESVWPRAEAAPEATGAARRSRSGIRVKGTIQAAGKAAMSGEPVAFASSFLLKKRDAYLLVVTKKMRNSMRLGAERKVKIAMEPDLERLDLAVPPELTGLLREDRAVLRWYGQLAPSVRRWIAGTIREPKAEAVRQRRAEQWAERLMLAMEGELETPPILKAAFRLQPQAGAGWALLTANQRRLYLLTIFSSRSPGARAKRVEAAVAHSLRAVKRKGRGRAEVGDRSASSAEQSRGNEWEAVEEPRPRKKVKSPWPSGSFGF